MAGLATRCGIPGNPDAERRRPPALKARLARTARHRYASRMAASDDRLARIRENPKYHALVTRRRRLAWTLTAIICVAYFGYILLIAFDKDVLARPIGDGAMTLGIPIGFGLILLGIALTAFYVRIANRHHDSLLAEIVAEAGE